MSGRSAIAPCGHPGEHVFGGYVRCLIGCDAAAGVGSGASPVESSPPGHQWGAADIRGIQSCGRCDVHRFWSSGQFSYWRGQIGAGVPAYSSELPCIGAGAP